ncbi:glycine C-acetyltransferase [Pseudoalteromonas sp. BSi20652]|nr:glycine C-acetyltransferase [Pseudoalteromonas sp. BSi20652]
MRASAFFSQLQQQIEDVKTEGLYKSERIIKSQQQAQIEVASGKVINFCANNYLGLANSPELIEAAQNGLNNHGFGVASVRFICGTQDIHKTLEKKSVSF